MKAKARATGTRTAVASAKMKPAPVKDLRATGLKGRRTAGGYFTRLESALKGEADRLSDVGR